MDRREFSKTIIEAVASYALFQTLFEHSAFAREIRPVTDRWVTDLHDMAMDIRSGRITPREWQDRIEELYQRVEFSDLVRMIDFDRLSRRFEYPERGVNTARVQFPKLDNLPERLGFTSKLFGMRQDRAIIPHGHRNMVSCHYVLQGDLHLRHYQKMEEDERYMVIQPTVDEVVGIGTYSSISDEHNNVHWLRALTQTAFTFDVIVVDVNGGQWEVDNIDPYAAEAIGGGLIRAPKLEVTTALEKYGHESHH